LVEKPLLAADQPEPDRQSIQTILSLTVRLELFWIVLLGLTQ
jgi:adenosylcobinamide-phosphate synthase